MFYSFFAKKNISVPEFTEWVSKLDGEITYIERFQARNALFGGFGGLDPRLVSTLKARGIGSLYSHQSKAVSLTLSGHDVVIVTPTASGKTLCYNLPVIDTILKDPASRALYLFPTKALAQDQMMELDEFSAVLGEKINCSTYDGDTPAAQRSTARDNSNVMITNPDMLNAGILPHHTRWAPFFQNLRFIVVDELHTYRGIFGSHLANLFSRLLRICKFYGSHPVFICCSATIANPAEHAEALIGRHAELISENGAPSSAKEFIIYDPPVIDKQTGIRRSALFETARIASKALCGGISTIVFTRSRLNVELLLKLLSKRLAEQGKDPDIVTGYRGGYLPKERRTIEQDLRSGKLRGVVCTNALELGIDIGSLELAVLHGYPGSIASTWQQIGRAGRRGGGLSAAVMVATALPLDQFLAARPEWLLGASPELARIDASNPYIEVGHVRCSAFELPFHEGENFGGQDISTILNYLAQHGVLRLADDFGSKTYYWQGDSYPAASMSLRNAIGENYTITDISDGKKPGIIGTMDRHSAPTHIFPGAIYFHGGRPYIVEDLNTETRQCFVKTTAADYYTEGESSVRINVIEEFEHKGLFGWGEVIVASTPSIYKKIRLTTHENIGHGEINLPEEQMETTACWISMPKGTHDSPKLGAAMSGFSNLIRNIAPLFLMCDSGDIQIYSRLEDPHLRQPAVFVVDNIPGGVGLAEGTYELKEKLVKASLDALNACGCANGCPACIGATPDGIGVKDAVKCLSEQILNER
ncbi:MAG: DEAD/DEAH box helicase [Synergistaceae bacterium]|nr:DEAD/DEAH box helicase [Synergistaceae bacterium]